VPVTEHWQDEAEDHDFPAAADYPVMLVRGRVDRGMPLTVADGYHRICASHHIGEDADVPCRLVAWP
jgi:hypothetical protein